MYRKLDVDDYLPHNLMGLVIQVARHGVLAVAADTKDKAPERM